VKLSGEVGTVTNANFYKTFVLIYCFNESYETDVLMSRKIHKEKQARREIILRRYAKSAPEQIPPIPPLEKGGVACRCPVSPPFLKGDLGGFGDLMGEL
jgi:hypothetical protein